MRLKDLTKNISNMTDDELREHVRQMRITKEVTKPAHAKHVADAHKKVTKEKTGKVNKLISGMSEEEKKQLRLLLEGDEDGKQS